MTNLLIRNLDERVLGALKEQAAANRRSLQQELHAILGQAAEAVERRRMRIEAYQRAKAISDRLAATGHVFPDPTDLIRADRDNDYGNSW
jgi:plasmid stability protein